MLEINSRIPTVDDFDQMSMISKGSIRSTQFKGLGSSSKGLIDGQTPKFHKKPLVFIDVNLGKEKGKQKLTVYKEDDPKQVAEKFALVHALGPGKALMLEKMLKQKISEHMSKTTSQETPESFNRISSMEPSTQRSTYREQ